MTELDDKYWNIQNQLSQIEEKELSDRNYHKRLENLLEESVNNINRVIKMDTQILGDLYDSHYINQFSYSNQSLLQDREVILRNLSDALRNSEDNLKQQQIKLEELAERKRDIIQRMREEGEL